jgi:uncharacterized repeat protein (TIGR01451 family)
MRMRIKTLLAVLGTLLSTGPAMAANVTLTVLLEGTGTGTVNSAPAGIDYGALCSGSFPQFSTVTLTPSAGPDSFFAGWKGGDCFGTGPCRVSLTTNNRTVRAYFAGPAALTVLSTSPADGDTGFDTRRSVQITFSDIVLAGPTFDQIEMRNGNTGEGVSIFKALYSGKPYLYLDPSGLEAETPYTVSVPEGAVVDPAGNPLEAPLFFTFTTGRRGEPKLFLSTHPLHVMEGDDVAVSLWFDRVQERDRILTLTSSPSGQLSHSSEVEILAGQIKLDLVIESLGNHVIEPDRSVTLSARSDDGQQVSAEVRIKDDDPIVPGPLLYAAAGITWEEDQDGVFEAGERADLLVELHNTGSTSLFNVAVAVEVVNTFFLETRGSGTCQIGTLQARKILGCEVGLVADGDLPSGRYFLRIKGTSSGSSFTDFEDIDVVNRSLPDFQVSNSIGTSSFSPGTSFIRDFDAANRGDGFSVSLPRLRVFRQRDDGGAVEQLYETYADVRGNGKTQQEFIYNFIAPEVPGTYRYWAAINPGGEIPESSSSNNVSSPFTVVVTEPNLPPGLDFIGDRMVEAGALLSFQATAGDPNPGSVLTWSLAGAPVGAVINSATGVFTWTPAEEQAPGDYLVTVVVTDDGSPKLSDSQEVLLQATRTADLSLAKSATAQTIDPGGTLGYVFDVGNAGPSAAVNLTLSDSLPPGVQFLAWSGEGWTCSETGGMVTCTRPRLESGAVTQLQLSILAPATLGAMINTAGVAGVGTDPDGSDNQSSVTVTVRQTFSDVPPDFWAFLYIQSLYNAGVTSVCAPQQFCPAGPVTREQMAIFIERALRRDFTPPAATGIFEDVPPNVWSAGWIEQLYADGITGGCAVAPLRYCPSNPVTRDQMAVFLLRARYGPGYAPPAPIGIFSDVPTGFWAEAWIEQLYREGITAGCATSPLRYCPGQVVNRAEMAAFLTRAFALPLP